MASYVEAPTGTFTAGEALDLFLRTKLSSGKLVKAGAGEASLGTTESKAFADGDAITIRYANAQGTRKMVASAAIAVGATVYGAANGKISTTVSGTAIGIVVNIAAVADGDVVEVAKVM